MDFLSSLDAGLYLENLDIHVSWNINQEELLDLLKNFEYNKIENAVCKYCGISINSKFLNSEEQATITFNFVKRVLKSVNVSFPLYENNLVQSFEFTQHFLEEKLGKPTSQNFFNSQEKKFRWKLRNIVITHELFESFSWRETLEISMR